MPPVGPGSRLPVFGRFFADIGDQQSIAASLSTFSAHVAKLARILDEADGGDAGPARRGGQRHRSRRRARRSRRRRSVTLTARGTLTLATTHLGALKDLASHTPGRGERVAPVRRRDAHADLPVPQGRARALVRPRDRAAARRRAPRSWRDAEARVPERERELDALLAAVEERAARAARARRRRLGARAIELDALGARLAERRRRRRRRARRSSSAGRRTPSAPARQQAQQLPARGAAAGRAGARRGARGGRRRGGPRGAAAGGGGDPRAGRAAGRRRSDASGDGRRGRRRRRGDRATGSGSRRGEPGEVLEVRADGKLRSSRRGDEDGGRAAIGRARPERAGDQPVARRPVVAPLRRALACLARDRPARHDRRRGGDGDARGARRRGAGGAALSPHHPRQGNRAWCASGCGGWSRATAGSPRFGFAPRNQGGTGVTVVEFRA